MSVASHYDASAGIYDRVFGRVSREFVPTLLRAARLAPGMRVLDIATGTGNVAEAALAVVGPTGRVAAADLSPAMLERARERLGGRANLSFSVEDGQALGFRDRGFDAVLCGLALMHFPDPAKGLAELRRVLREGGRAAVSVPTTSERSFSFRVLTAIGRHVPSRAAEAAQNFLLGDPARLRALFEGAGFRDVETLSEARRYAFPSFDAYFEHFGRGAGGIGAEYAALPEEARRAVREDVRRGLEGDQDTGGPVEVPVEFLFGSGCR
ncbi:MAG: methyltransferase domain-containing protein [Acetobacteraceae bacterium]|nr:methyltransferase domain-containing protein [Acetobacteraceae bacterium]